MSLFNRTRTTQEQQDYESFMAGYRSGFPVEDDQPAQLSIDSQNAEFQRGLNAGTHDCQENQAFLTEHPDFVGSEEEQSSGFFSRLKLW